MDLPESSAPAATLPEPASACHLLDELRSLNDRLQRSDLRPSAETDATFGRLVELCTSTDERTAGEVLARPGITELLRSLRRISADGETLLEQHWAGELVESTDPWAVLHRFPYLDNYRDLVRVERAAAAAAGAGNPRTVAFLGAGPLPLTGLVHAHDHGTRVVNVDCDERACTLAAGTTRALGLSDRVSTVHADAAAAAQRGDVATADVVVLAALVGEDSSGKSPVLDVLARRLHPGTTLLVRSAHRMRAALYPVVSVDELHGFRPLLEVHPCNDVVNSVLVARPR
ncbi:nicotianamine synthase family protein [Bounagaea algeriensis]